MSDQTTVSISCSFVCVVTEVNYFFTSGSCSAVNESADVSHMMNSEHKLFQGEFKMFLSTGIFH